MDNLQVELLTDRIARLHWADGSATVNGEFDTYRLQFRKDDPQFDWHQHDTDSTEQMLYDLVPQATYEARIQGGRKDAAGRLYWGDYSRNKSHGSRCLWHPHDDRRRGEPGQRLLPGHRLCAGGHLAN